MAKEKRRYITYKASGLSSGEAAAVCPWGRCSRLGPPAESGMLAPHAGDRRHHPCWWASAAWAFPSRLGCVSSCPVHRTRHHLVRDGDSIPLWPLAGFSSREPLP